jgi:hypothetical protein
MVQQAHHNFILSLSKDDICLSALYQHGSGPAGRQER